MQPPLIQSTQHFLWVHHSLLLNKLLCIPPSAESQPELVLTGEELETLVDHLDSVLSAEGNASFYGTYTLGMLHREWARRVPIATACDRMERPRFKSSSSTAINDLREQAVA